MRCRRFKKLLPLHAGGDLDEVPAGLEEHLRTCDACRRELETYRGLIGALGRAKASAPQDDDAFLAGVYRKNGSVRLAAVPVARPLAGRLLAAGAAAAAVAFLVAGILLLPKGEPVETGAPAATPAASVPVETPAPPAVETPVPPPAGPAVFGLTQAAPEENGAQSALVEAEVVPDPRTIERPGTFGLGEMVPVQDGESLSDF